MADCNKNSIQCLRYDNQNRDMSSVIGFFYVTKAATESGQGIGRHDTPVDYRKKPPGYLWAG